MDTIIYRVEHVCGYSMVTTEITVKISKKNLFTYTDTYGELKNILKDTELWLWLNPFEADDGDIISYEVYNGYRMNKEKYFDIKTGLRSFFQFLTNNTVMYVAFQVFYLNFITHKYKEALNHFQINRYNKLSPNHYIDDRGNYFTVSEPYRYKNYLFSTYQVIDLVHQTVNDNINAFGPDNVVYEKIIKEDNQLQLRHNIELVNEILNDITLNELMNINEKIIRLRGRIFIESDKSKISDV